MHPKNLKLKRALDALSSTEDKLSAMRGYYEGESAILFSCGPSFNSNVVESLRGLFESCLVVSIKQAYNILGEAADFHLYNWVNLQKYKHSERVISIGENCYPSGKSLLMGAAPTVELLFSKDAYTDAQNRGKWLVNTQNYDSHRLDVGSERPLGPGIMVEVALYLLLHLGVANVYCIGWDLTPPTRQDKQYIHFYDKDRIAKTVNRLAFASKLGRCNPLTWGVVVSFRRWLQFHRGEVVNKSIFLPNENDEVIRGSYEFYKYFLGMGMNTFIVSEQSHLDPRIPRLCVEDLLRKVG